MFKVYLAGPIDGGTYDSVTEWRQYVESVLPDGIEAISPMRDKSKLKGLSSRQFYTVEDPLLTPKGIVTRDYHDVSRSDVVLMNLRDAGKVSIGTMVELGWAWCLRKPVIAVLSSEDSVHPSYHPFLIEMFNFRAPDLDTAVSIIKSLAGSGG